MVVEDAQGSLGTPQVEHRVISVVAVEGKLGNDHVVVAHDCRVSRCLSACGAPDLGVRHLPAFLNEGDEIGTACSVGARGRAVVAATKHHHRTNGIAIFRRK